MDISFEVKEFITSALREDLGPGDITSSLTIPMEHSSTAKLIAKEDFVLAGLPFAREVFSTLARGMEFRALAEEGAAIGKGDSLASIRGNTRALLAAERVALNILQRLSGIATLTGRFVKEVEGTGARILDTRKTVPGMRVMDKYAVRTGGGHNHRTGLFDGILIKDNHIKAAGGIREAIALAKQSHHLLKVEVEVETLDGVEDALAAGADIIMLDNMSFEMTREAVGIAKGRALLEVSGNVSLDNVRSIAETGVDMISVGALTHSPRAADISMKLA